MHLSKEDVDPSRGRNLLHAVLVGMPVEAVGVEYQKIIRKFCGPDLTIGREPDVTTNVFVTCRPSTPYTRPWLMLYCISDNCLKNEAAAATVSRTIAADPDVIALAQAGGARGYPKGPYLIEVNIDC